MEAYFTPRYYEPHSGLLTLTLSMGLGMLVLYAGYKAAMYDMIAKSSPGKSYQSFFSMEMGMSKKELWELLRKTISAEVEILERRMAARESQLDEAIDTVHQHEVRIAALEERYDKAMEEMGALRASIHSCTPENLPATPSVQSPPSKCSSWALSYHSYNSEDDSINGVKDHESEPLVSSSLDQEPEVFSPQLDSALEDELAELGGWGLDIEASDDDNDGNITDQDAEGETDDEYGGSEKSIPCTSSELEVVREPIRPLSKCKTKGASILQG
ncbi:hypothetical protein G6011_01315 [Alternaria panax]|uniref:Uncharacterized protein n=1 Tax=Alternaria panax TaxID=48097 RepID=A0AAD4NVT4_9PLEO|nr:hypothetical protein G6011_01315 [Alternaria panax]